jgi:hypothetical protein
VQLISVSFQCYRLFKDVNNFVVSNVHVTRMIGEAPSSASQGAHRAAEKAHVKRLEPPPLHFMVQEVASQTAR